MSLDAWLERNTGYCIRLSARITPTQCETNKKTEHISCQGCEGLDMAKQFKSYHKKCSVAGCEKQAWKDGMCCKHFNQLKQHREAEDRSMLTESANDSHLKDALPPEPAVSESYPADPQPENLLLPLPVDPAPERSGIFIDFSGQEDLMRWLFDMCGDTTDASVAVLGLLKARKDGLLRMEVA